MTLVNLDAHNTEVVCLITLADSYKNICKLSKLTIQWSTFAKQVNDENRVKPEIEKMTPLAKHVF